jgi:ABC-type glycerol-3-phosphate transport system substrate-binding protein
MKKISNVLLLSVLLAAVLSARGANDPSRSTEPEVWLPGNTTSGDIIETKGLPDIGTAPVKVDYLTIWTSGKSAEEEKIWLTTEIQKIYPNITVEIERLGTNPLKEAATIRVIAGTPPTMARISGGYAIDEFIRQGLLQDVTKYWEYYNLMDIVPEALVNAFKFNGKYYGFPSSDAPQALLYWNKDVFNEAGIPEPPYASWDDFFKAAEKWSVIKPGKPFYTYSLNPGWYGLERAFVQAATMFGKAYIFRIFNGEATEKDFTNLLEFNKKLISVSNADYTSLEGTQGIHELVIRGDAGLCYSGSWGYTAFESGGIKNGVNLGFSLLPGHPMNFTTMSGLIVFARSGKETAGNAIAVHSMLKDVQARLNRVKDNIPARNDIVINPSDGWSAVVSYIYSRLQAGADVIPRANSGFPSTVLSAMEPVFVSCMTGKTGIQETAARLFNIQNQNKDKFSLIRW